MADRLLVQAQSALGLVQDGLVLVRVLFTRHLVAHRLACGLLVIWHEVADEVVSDRSAIAQCYVAYRCALSAKPDTPSEALST